MRKQFTTSVDESILNNFKAACAKNGLLMNSVIEMFMRAYAEGKFQVEMKYDPENTGK